MRSVSYQIKGATAEKTADIRRALEALSLVEKASVVYRKDSESFLAVLRLVREEPEEGDTLATLDKAVGDAMAQLELQVVAGGLPLAETYVTAPSPKEGKKIPLSAAIGSVITAVILAILLTFGLTTLSYRNQATHAADPNEDVEFTGAVGMVDLLFESLSPLELDKDALLETVLKAYVAATGDKYAEYFNQQELEDFIASQKGEMSGIGVTIVDGHITVGGEEWQAIIIASVYVDSPAEESGVMPGDAIVYVGTGDDKTSVQAVGYTQALSMLKGEVGTTADFVVYRATGDAENPYEIKEFSVERKKLQTHSVTGTVCETDAKVGVVKITGFDDTTAPQLVETIEKLQGEGCDKFVFDLRGNPGGALTSIIDVLTYFLDEGDVVISTKDKYEQEEITKVGSPNSKGYVTSGTGTLKAEDIGRFKDLSFVVLVNEYTASAAELFTANVRDYELGQIVGVTTYGKGTMQQTYDLSRYGYEGALKLTTKYYYPPSGEGYDGVGIVPDSEIELSEEAASYNINLLPHEKDNQLQEAIRLLNE